MFLESLGLRSKLTPSTNERENFSNHSTPTPSILSPPGTPQSSRSKRYSNNLFGSGRLRDYSYLKTVNQQKNGGRVQSSSSDSLRPVTPDSTMPPSSVQSSPSGNDSSYYEEDIPPRDLSRSGLTSLKPGSASYKRASMAVEEAIKELEEESDEKIVMPRSTPRMVNNGDVSPIFVLSSSLAKAFLRSMVDLLSLLNQLSAQNSKNDGCLLSHLVWRTAMYQGCPGLLHLVIHSTQMISAQ